MRKVLLLIALVFGLMLVPGIALADDQVVADSSLHQVQVLSLLVGTVLPILVNLFTKMHIDNGVRAVILAALSAVTALLAEAINVGGFTDAFDWWGAALSAIMTFVVAVATHYGLWAPTGVAEKAQRSLIK